MNVLFEGNRQDFMEIVDTINHNLDYLIDDRSRIITLEEILAGTPLAYDERVHNYCVLFDSESGA